MIKVNGGKSTKDGITFKADNYSVKSKLIGHFLNFKINCDDSNDYAIMRFLNKLEENKFINFLIFIIETVLLCIFECFFIKKFATFMFVLYTVITASTIISNIVIFFNKDTSRNHSAEHKMFNAYNKMKVLPSIEDAKKFSRFNINCGTNLFFTHIVTYILYIFVNTKFPLFTVRRICRFLNIKAIFTPLQILTTRTPSDKNMYIAQSTLKRLIEVEECSEYDWDELYILVNNKMVLKACDLYGGKNKKYIVLPNCSTIDVKQAIINYYTDLPLYVQTIKEDSYIPIECFSNIIVNYNGILLEINETNYNDFENIYKECLSKRGNE